MTESVIGYSKNSMEPKKFAGILIQSAFKALVSTAVIVLAVYLVMKPIIPMQEGGYIMIAVAVIGSLIAYPFALGENNRRIIKKISDVFYTKDVSGDDNFVACVKSGIFGLCISFLTVVTVALEPEAALQIFLVFAAAFLVLTYSTRNNLSFNTLFTNAEYSLIFSGSVYLIGLVIVLSANIVGVAITAGIVALEVAFTAAYTYIDLIRWVEESKTSIEEAKEYYQKRMDEDQFNPKT